MNTELRYVDVLKSCTNFEIAHLMATLNNSIPQYKAQIKVGKNLIEDGIDLRDKLAMILEMRELAEEEASIRRILVAPPDRDLKPM